MTVITYGYDKDGNLTTRTPANSTSSTYTYDELDRITNISHGFAGSNTRTFRYGYDLVSNRTFSQRDGGNGDVYRYDLNDQANGVVLNTAIPTAPATPTPAPATITYDANGNRLTFGVYGGSTDTYAAANNLNQYPSRGANSAAYDLKGNMITNFDGSGYTYDAQNRLLTATKGGVTYTFKYDGLNRQVSRLVTGSAIIYNVYDGWELIAEYASGASTPSTAYLGGAGGLVKNLTTNNYYYQDGSGSTSHLASGRRGEWGRIYIFDISRLRVTLLRWPDRYGLSSKMRFIICAPEATSVRRFTAMTRIGRSFSRWSSDRAGAIKCRSWALSC